MNENPKDVIVLGIIKSGIKSFDKIFKMAKVSPEELNRILEKLESREFISVKEKKGLFGKKVEIFTTEKGAKELEHRIHELEGKWNQMTQLYKSGEKQKLKKYMDENKISFKEMMFFGVLDMLMFSMMFSMIGMSMDSFVSPEDMPQDMSDGADVDSGGDGFDIDIGF
jgi:DNA-binding PadR family transcriptional regulator